MKVATNSVYYNSVMGTKEESVSKKKVLLTNYGDIATAIDKGTLTVDGVTLELSEEVRNAIKEARDKQIKDNETATMLSMMEHNAKVAREQNDAAKEATDMQVKALEIARRIAKGGRVPMKDEKLLLEYNPDLYKMAKNMAIMAKEHKKYKSLIKDDEKKTVKQPGKEGDGEDAKTRYQVQIEVSLGDAPAVESVAEVAVSSGEGVVS